MWNWNIGKKPNKLNKLLSQYVVTVFSVENSIGGLIVMARLSKSIAIGVVHESLVPWSFLEVPQGQFVTLG